jgi:EAL and modified HD-GYP domain-containing signal transduction protein
MSDTILDSVALAYQPVWNRQRRLAAVRVAVLAVNPDSVDGAHLLEAIGEDWPVAAPLLSLSFSSQSMRNQALASEPVHNTLIEVPAQPFTTPEGLAPLALAVRRGHQLLRQATLAEVRSELIAPLDVRNLLRASAEEALEALRVRAANADKPSRLLSPILAGHLYEGIGCRALAELCLDEEGAWGLAGWPQDDVLHGWRDRPLLGSGSVIRECQQAIENDCSLDQLERFLRQDPVLVYRLLMLVNSATYGSDREIATLRHAIMMLGFAALKHWLGEQLAGSETDENLHPVRYGQVMRARLAQHLLDPGCAEDLRAELYLTALFSQIDRLIQKPIGPLLHKLPLSERLLDAVLRKGGAYFPLLEVAAAQGSFEHVHLLPAVCSAHEIPLEQANRSLLRMLATSRDQSHPPREHPWAMHRS